MRAALDRFFARDYEREARARGEIELADIYRQYGRQRLIACVGLALTLVLIGMSLSQLLFNYGRPMSGWFLGLFLGAAFVVIAYSMAVIVYYRHRP